MIQSDYKMVSLLIVNALNRYDYSNNQSFKGTLTNLFKEIDDSIKLYLAEKKIVLPEIEKQKLIQEELEKFITREVKQFFKVEERIQGGWSQGTSGSQSNQGQSSQSSSSDDPSGSNW